MIVGVTDWCLDQQGPLAVKECGALGFHALQLGIAAEGEQRLTAADWLSELRGEAENHGVRIAGIALNVLELQGTGATAACPTRRRAVQLVNDALDAARKLGASLIYIPAFGQNRIVGDGGIERAADFLRAACRMATGHDINIASENTLGPGDNARLAREVDQPNFRILLDTYNAWLWRHSIVSLISLLRPWLADQAHVKDGIGEAMGAAPLGEGDGDTRGALEAFAAAGYQGAFFLENDYRGPNRRRAAVDIHYIRQHFSAKTVTGSTPPRSSS